MWCRFWPPRSASVVFRQVSGRYYQYFCTNTSNGTISKTSSTTVSTESSDIEEQLSNKATTQGHSSTTSSSKPSLETTTNLNKENKSFLSKEHEPIVFDKKQLYSLEQALDIVKKSVKTDFDETIEACFRVNIDDRKANQRIRDKILYPVSPIKHTLVAVFTKDPKEIEQAKEAGADYIGEEELLARIKKRKFKFYWLVTSPQSVKGLASVSKILGPRGMMPTEKMGTLTNDIDVTVREFKKGYLRIENDPEGNVHSVIGKLSWPVPSLIENCCYLYQFLLSRKPSNVKRGFFMALTVSSTMGPGVHVDTSLVKEIVEKQLQKEMRSGLRVTSTTVSA
eukprot:jgi/Galph1/4847/GphlegSOOS_G3514.1